MTLKEKINSLNPDTMVSLKTEYGVFWMGRAKYVFGAVTMDAWNGTEIEVLVHHYNGK